MNELIFVSGARPKLPGDGTAGLIAFYFNGRSEHWNTVAGQVVARYIPFAWPITLPLVFRTESLRLLEASTRLPPFMAGIIARQTLQALRARQSVRSQIPSFLPPFSVRSILASKADFVERSELFRRSESLTLSEEKP